MNKGNNNQKRVLFACTPADGHYGPLTGVAHYLLQHGYDVRWYASSHYKSKIEKLGITHYPFQVAKDVTADTIDRAFPQRKQIKSAVGKLKFDLEYFFINRGPEYYRDIVEIYKGFPFDLLIVDNTFTGAVFVKELMKIPVIAIGVFPLTEYSKDLPPAGLGMVPSHTFAGRLRDKFLNMAVEKVLFRRPNKLFHRILAQHGIDHKKLFLFDLLVKKTDYFLQSGTPGFEYMRSDLSSHIKFIGALLPYHKKQEGAQWFDNRVYTYNQVVLVTQGTVEKDVNKLLVPTLEAFKGSDTLVICTTGGAQTQELQAAYDYANIIIEDFIPFDEVMPYADVYITNGGYGGVMLGIEHKLPLVVAGVHEGKNEICARIGYFNYGINLKTETPTPLQIKNAVAEAGRNPVYKTNISALCAEFKDYDAPQLVARYAAALIEQYKNDYTRRSTNLARRIIHDRSRIIYK